MKRGFTFTEVLFTFAIFAAITALLFPVASAVANKASREANQKSKETQSHIKAFDLYTAQHDGHLWVLNRTSDYFLHHPDCPCKENKAEREP